MKPMFHVAGTVLAAALSLAANAADITLKLNSLHTAEHPVGISHEFFAERVGILTNGTVEVEVHTNRALGDAVESVQSIRNGTIAFFTVSSANLSQVMPQMDMFSLPFVFKNARHYWWYLTSDRAAAFVKPLEDKGIKVLAFMDSGARSFFSKDPIRSPADLKGKKIRVMASPVAVAMIDAMGGTGVPVAWGELYNALQTGVVDGAENNPPSIRSMKFYEVTNHFTINEHARIPDILVMSKKLFDRLSPEQQAAIDQAGKETEAFMRGAWASSEVSSLQFVKEKMEVIDKVDKQPFIDAVTPLLKKEGERLGVSAEVDYLLESGRKF
ncbi:MAG: TRAP transporter substrate-binding protein [Ectothiorhodospiraceae bacterium]|nr:TRAP transporter substrate-binding protein [Chromatiales bacterium]MCP5154133.1 TRAP transporter substrate-binding protein [Ectothiorhodospiraceae bacterium]